MEMGNGYNNIKKGTFKMNLVWRINCPYCGYQHEIDLEDYVVDVSSNEREMGAETEYTIECEEYECDNCEKKFGIQGSVWEYPEGAYNDSDIEIIELENGDN